MAVNKVTLYGVDRIDLTSDTISAEDLLEGVTAHGADGERIVGNLTVNNDYEELSSKPKINGVELSGDKTASELGITGGVPVGTVIYFAGLTAPNGYLACDGKVYNISDYPELAAFFDTNYGGKNYWGGDGVTTFGVPDWRGEFFRAAGQNPWENQGSGADVGKHQNATEIPDVYPSSGGTKIQARKQNSSDLLMVKSPDFELNSTFNIASVNTDYTTGTMSRPETYTTRPTNTSLLVCIKAN